GAGGRAQDGARSGGAGEVEQPARGSDAGRGQPDADGVQQVQAGEPLDVGGQRRQRQHPVDEALGGGLGHRSPPPSSPSSSSRSGAAASTGRAGSVSARTRSANPGRTASVRVAYLASSSSRERGRSGPPAAESTV